MRGVLRSPLASSIAASLLAAPGLAQAALDLRMGERGLLVGLNIAIFVALIYPTNRFIMQPLLRVLQERKSATEGTVSRAGELQVDSVRRSGELEQQLVAARSRAQERRGAILAEAEAAERSVIGAAREAANQTIAEVRGAIADELVSARSALESDVRGLAREAAVKILGREL